MEREFIIAERIYNNKILYSLLPVTGIVVFFAIFNKYLHALYDNRLLFSLLVLAVFIYLIFVLVSVKSFKTIGHLVLNPYEVRIEMGKQISKYNISDIESMRLSYKGIYGEDMAGWAGGVFAAISKDGSGNYLSFSTKEKTISLNLAFEKEEDFSAILFLFNEINDKHPLQPEVVKRGF